MVVPVSHPTTLPADGRAPGPGGRRAAYREDGYAVLPGLLGPAELARLAGVVARAERIAAGLRASTGDIVLEAPGPGGWVAWQRGEQGGQGEPGGPAPLPGVLRSVRDLHVRVPELLGLLDDVGLARREVEPVVGGPVDLVTTYLWAKPAEVGSAKPWHQDMAFAPPGFTGTHRGVVTVWIAVDPATRDNGCLEVVPGTHTSGLFPHAGTPERAGGGPTGPTGDGPAGEGHTGGGPAGDGPAGVERAPVEPHVDVAAALPDALPVEVELAPGSAVLFDGMLLHRSAPNATAAPRRAVSVVYAIPRERAPGAGSGHG